MQVQLLFFDECPNWKILDDRLAELSSLAEFDVEHVRVETEEEARRLGFVGSPSLRLDGRDPFPSPGASPGLACRIYRTPGGPAGAPTVEQLRDLLAVDSR